MLAGGRSRRFGSDKLEAMLDGRPLLEHALLAASAVCQEVICVRAPGDAGSALAADLAASVTVIVDERSFEGPLTAVVGAAAHARGDRILLIGGDMPWLVPAVLRRLLDYPPEREGAGLQHDGEPAPLPLAIGREALLRHGAALLAEGQASLRSLLGRADLEAIAEAEWRWLDPEARSLRDVDRPDDL